MRMLMTYVGVNEKKLNYEGQFLILNTYSLLYVQVLLLVLVN